MLVLALLMREDRVPIVLDGVVAAPYEHSSDLSPSVSDSLVKDEEDPIFLHSPVGFLQERVELIMPTFTALLSCAMFHLFGHLLPLVRAHGLDHSEKL